MSMNKTCPIWNLTSDEFISLVLRVGDDFGKSRIFAQRIPHRIEAKIGTADSGGHFEQMWKRADSGIEITKTRLNLCERSFGVRLADGVGREIGYRALRLLQRLFFFTKTG